MGDNALFYRDTYTRGAVEHWQETLVELREAAKETNKSRSGRRKELAALIKDLDSQIGQSQTALERLDTTHFRAHLTTSKAAATAARASSRGRRNAGSALDKLRKQAAAAVAGATKHGTVESLVMEELAKGTNEEEYKDAIRKIFKTPGIARILAKEQLVYADHESLSADEAAIQRAIALGTQDGLKTGISFYLGEKLESLREDAITDVVTEAIVDPDEARFELDKEAAGARTVSTALRSSGGLLTNADVDKMFAESGLARDVLQRENDLMALSGERQRLAAEAAGLPADMTEEDILRQAAARTEGVGAMATSEYGPGIIGAFRRESAAKESMAAFRAEREKTDTLRTAINSLQPEQRVAMQATINANSMFANVGADRQPQDASKHFSSEILGLSEQIRNAMKNDQSLRGNQAGIVNLAIELSKQKNPKGSQDTIMRDRDSILEAFNYNTMSNRRLKQNTDLAEKTKAPKLGGSQAVAIDAMEERGQIGAAEAAYLKTLNADEAREVMNNGPLQEPGAATATTTATDGWATYTRHPDGHVTFWDPDRKKDISVKPGDRHYDTIENVFASQGIEPLRTETELEKQVRLQRPTMLMQENPMTSKEHLQLLKDLERLKQDSAHETEDLTP